MLDECGRGGRRGRERGDEPDDCGLDGRLAVRELSREQGEHRPDDRAVRAERRPVARAPRELCDDARRLVSNVVPRRAQERDERPEPAPCDDRVGRAPLTRQIRDHHQRGPWRGRPQQAQHGLEPPGPLHKAVRQLHALDELAQRQRRVAHAGVVGGNQQ